MKTITTEREVLNVLTAHLQDVPFIRVKSMREQARLGDFNADAVISLRTRSGASVRVIVEVKASGQPRIARDAVNQLVRFRREAPDAYGVFGAPFVSREAAEICTKEGIGYLDLAGNCRLSFDQVFISREGFRKQLPEKRELRSLYAPKASRVLRVLLMHSKEWWKTQALAGEASVSLGQVQNVKNRLRDREWIAEQRAGFRLINPQALLKEWAENYTYRRNTVRDFYAMGEPDEVEEAVSRVCQEQGIPYALTAFSAASRVAPSVRGQRTTIYVSTVSDDLVNGVGLREVPSGANVSLMVPYDEGVYYSIRDIGSRKIVSPVQLYLDLKGYRGRGEEAAEAVWQKELVPIW